WTAPSPAPPSLSASPPATGPPVTAPFVPSPPGSATSLRTASLTPTTPKSGRASSTASGTPTSSPSRLTSLAASLPSSSPSPRPSPLAARYFASFLLTIRREWGGIDFLRLDKFYLLIRKFLRYAFLLERMGCGAVSPANRYPYPANGVNYHVAEVFLDAMREFLPLAVETSDLMLKPFISVLEKSADNVLVNKIELNVFCRLLDNGRKLLNLEKNGVQVDLGSEVEKLGRVSLLLVFSKQLLDSASASETLRGKRKILFGFHDDFLWLENDLEKSGVHISTEKLENGSSENVISTVVSESTEQVEPFKSLDPAHSRSKLLESSPTRNFP
ncbi:unnamed protein product, partial [Musa acuminata subsp. burmannicoides]